MRTDAKCGDLPASRKSYSLADNPSASALDFWNTVLQPPLNGSSASDRALIDYLEGPNEGDTPMLGYPNSPAGAASQWFNQFWTNLTPRIVSAGYKPCIGSIALGRKGKSVSPGSQSKVDRCLGWIQDYRRWHARYTSSMPGLLTM
ncbi:MAG: hypothetical protein NT154_42570 [Verrucomicrobia bacterium]|nr:hypothetical protein [Verrucomicrobiota bacterium]